MKLEELDALNCKAYAPLGDVDPNERLDAIQAFRSEVGKMWPLIYRELTAARAMRDAMYQASDQLFNGYVIDGSEEVANLDAARRETDK